LILLDTHVVSAVMAPSPPGAVLAWLNAQVTDHLFLSTITVAEIGYGLRILPEGRRRRDLEARFHAFVARGFEQRILTFDLAAADRYADLMAHRRAMGRPMGVPDPEIAAIALAHRMRIPRQAGHRFHGKLDSDSTASWTPIPGQAGHLK